jgi:hypothetical protein
MTPHRDWYGEMSPAKFPARKPEGSFCVEVGLEIASNVREDLVPSVQAWIHEAWMPRYTTWSRDWKTGPDLATTRVQRFHYDDEFAAPPEVVAGLNSELRLRLRGKKTAKFWRDWLISRLIPDLKVAFPALGELLYVRNCAE